MVVEELPRLLAEKRQDDQEISPTALTAPVSKALVELSKRVHDYATAHPEFAGMGSTVVLALIKDKAAVIAHLGDSRAYLWRQGRLEQVTKDHSLVQYLVDLGEITPEEAGQHPARHQITRCIGMSLEPLPEVKVIDLAAGDRLLLCSDGLTGMVAAASIAAILAGGQDPEGACRGLVAAANEAGGRDNITTVVVDVNG
jgi:serine/threonine protein phosphatase PrpC